MSAQKEVFDYIAPEGRICDRSKLNVNFLIVAPI